jgi:Flp pilus assembly protein TadD
MQAGAQRGLGLALLSLGRGDEAIAPLTAAVNLDSTSADAHHHLGVAFGMVGDSDRALEQLTIAGRPAPDDPTSRTIGGSR